MLSAAMNQRGQNSPGRKDAYGLKKVLLVDDEPEIVQLFELVLEGIPASILGAYDGEMALEMVGEHRPQVVLSDIMMPKLDGYALCQRIRSDPASSDTKVILMTAFRELERGQCDAHAFLRKPLDPFALRDLVLSYLE